MQASETRFDNMPMSAFRVPIMFKIVGRRSEMGDTMGCEKISKSQKFTPIIYAKGFDGGGEILFNKLLECNKTKQPNNGNVGSHEAPNNRIVTQEQCQSESRGKLIKSTR